MGRGPVGCRSLTDHILIFPIERDRALRVEDHDLLSLSTPGPGSTLVSSRFLL